MNIAELSTMLVWGATTAYAIALVSFATLLARQSDAHAAERRGDVVAASVRATGSERAAGGAAGDGSTREKDGATAPADPVAGAPAGPVLPRRSRAEGIARSTVWAGLLLHVAAVVTRTIAAERPPWANLYEFMLVGSLIAVVVLIVLERRRTIPFLGTVVMGIVVLFLAVAQVNFFVPADGVQPALQSYWLVIHVGVAVIATGVFTVGVVVAILQLLRSARADSGRLTSRRWAWLESTPDEVALEGLSFRLNAVGFVLWTFTLIAGAIWAEHAWGRYWGWDPKEVWTFVIWVVYAGYLHARATRGWMGRRAAWLVIVAYLCVVANFTLVNMLFPGLHSYANI